MKHVKAKRGGAFILALLTLLSGGLFVLPVSASPGIPMKAVTLLPAEVPEDAAGFSTGFIDNRMTYDGNTEKGVYHGGWSIGCLTGTGYEHFTHTNSSSKTWLTRDTTDQWQSPAGTVNRGSNEMTPARGAGFATAYGFRAPRAGTVSFSFDSFDVRAGDYFAIFIGTRMIYPTYGLSFSESENIAAWYAVGGDEDAATVNRLLDSTLGQVEEGEVISFAFRRGQASGQSFAFPRVTYRTAGAATVSASRFNFRGENFPTYAGQSGGYILTGNAGGGWSIGSYPRDFSAGFTRFTQIDPTYCIINRGGTDQWAYGGIYLQNGVIITANNTITTLSYEMPASGRVNVRVGNITANQSGDGADIMFCILYNGKMIWPSAGGSMTNYDHWYNLTGGGSVSADAAVSSALQDLRVEAGDTVRYCFVARTGHSMSTKDVDLTVAYTVIDSSLPRPAVLAADLSANYPILRPVAEGGGLLGYRGRFAYVTEGENGFSTMLTTDAENNFVCAGGKVLTARQGADAAGFLPADGGTVGLSYTLRHGGQIKVSLGAAENPGYTVKLLKNGREVGRTQDGGHVFSLSADAGDVLILAVLRTGEMGETAEPLYLSPSVTYDKVSDRIAVTGVSMALSSDLCVKIYTAASLSYAEATGHGLLVWREGESEADAKRLSAEANMNNTCTYLFDGLSAKEMGDTVYFRPYIITPTEGRVDGGIFTFSVADYALSLYGTDSLRDRMLTDMLVYGAAAQAYFGYRTEEPVTDRLTAAQLACGSQTGMLFSSCLAKEEEDDRHILSSIDAFSLLLGSELRLRVFATCDGVEVASMFLEIATSPDFRDAESVRMKGSCDSTPIPFGDVSRTLYLRLRTGAYGGVRYSPVVTYSVESYIAHTVSASPAQGRLNEALLAYGNSARIYAYERGKGV